MMRRSSHQVAAVVLPVCLTNFAVAEDLTSFSDVQLAERAREAVVAQDAEAALDLLTEMQRRGTGVFAGAERSSCEEVIDLPEGITDWRFKGAARQAYITAAKRKALEAGACGCLLRRIQLRQLHVSILGQVGCRPHQR